MKPRYHFSGLKKFIIVLAAIFAFLFILFIINYLSKIYFSNVLDDGKDKYIFIRTGATFDDVCSELKRANALSDMNSFEWMAEKNNYVNNIKPGRYKISAGLGNKELVRLLRSGEQEPSRVIINNIRTVNQLAGSVSGQLEVDSAELVALLNNSDFLIGYYHNPQTALSIFIPNTYEFYWNTNARQFVKRMYKEFETFWNDGRRRKAEEIKMTLVEVMVLASIVEEETNIGDEYPVIAGVYINRLKRGMMLQADPTVKFALGNFAMKRVLRRDTEFKSHYNTYRVSGLPPGPICMPSIGAIDGVLNYEKHNYLYFCAKPDFSGRHAFAKNLLQHNQNAEEYWKALNKQRIFK